MTPTTGKDRQDSREEQVACLIGDAIRAELQGDASGATRLTTILKDCQRTEQGTTDHGMLPSPVSADLRQTELHATTRLSELTAGIRALRLACCRIERIPGIYATIIGDVGELIGPWS